MPGRADTATAIEHALSAGRLPARQDLAAWSAATDGTVQLAFPELVAPAAPSDDVGPLVATVQRHADALRTLRAIVRMRKQDPNERAEEETILETYMQALGMLPGSSGMAANWPAGSLPRPRERPARNAMRVA